MYFLSKNKKSIKNILVNFFIFTAEKNLRILFSLNIFIQYSIQHTNIMTNTNHRMRTKAQVLQKKKTMTSRQI